MAFEDALPLFPSPPRFALHFENACRNFKRGQHLIPSNVRRIIIICVPRLTTRCYKRGKEGGRDALCPLCSARARSFLLLPPPPLLLFFPSSYFTSLFCFPFQLLHSFCTRFNLKIRCSREREKRRGERGIEAGCRLSFVPSSVHLLQPLCPQKLIGRKLD